jgi:lipopolysaccharide/colanic/teichoic acid biosynthesis glycosyltransferase
MRQRLDLDLDYIKNWSFWFDVKILARTLLVPFSSPNAY